jgi:hypothetical protein
MILAFCSELKIWLLSGQYQINFISISSQPGTVEINIKRPDESRFIYAISTDAGNPKRLGIPLAARLWQ